MFLKNTIRIIILISVFLIITNLTSAQLNLPQLKVEVNIKQKDHKTLLKYFGQFEQAPTEFDSKIEKLLLSLFPKEYKKGCESMISHWGEFTKNTASNALRILYFRKTEKNVYQIFFAFTCFSNAQGYGDKYYDERLAVLNLDSVSSKLTIYPHSKPCDNCSELTRMALEEDTLTVNGNPFIGFIFGVSSKNPCCDGPTNFNEEILKFFILEPTNVIDALTFSKYRKETVHDDVLGDSTTLYQTQIDIEKDNKGDLSKITIYHTTTVQDEPGRGGMIWYTWNKKARRFDEGAR